MRSICAMRSLLAAAAAAAASAPTVLRAGAFPPRPQPRSLPFRRGRAAGNMLGTARSVSAAAQSRIGGGGSAMEARAVQSGEIHVIVGPMFAGKTTALLRRVQAEAGSGRYETPVTASPFVLDCVSPPASDPPSFPSFG